MLVTGATGFAGSYLLDLLLTKDVEVYGTRRRRSDMDLVRHVAAQVQWIEMDVIDFHNVLSVLRDVRPDHIYHLAAETFIPTSFRAPQETMITNVTGTLNLLEAVRTLNLNQTKLIITASSEEYGYVKDDEFPITENNPLRPCSPYGISKVAADLLGRQYHQSYGMDIVVTRAFNHYGPRQTDPFVTPNFSQQIVMIEKGMTPPVVKVGNLEAKRDFTDVRDMVKAYWLVMKMGEPGEVYNICSGTTISMKDLLDKVIALSTVQNIEIQQDPQRMRPSDLPILLGDYSKFHALTGWEPKITLEQTLEDTLAYWRGRI